MFTITSDSGVVTTDTSKFDPSKLPILGSPVKLTVKVIHTSGSSIAYNRGGQTFVCSRAKLKKLTSTSGRNLKQA